MKAGEITESVRTSLAWVLQALIEAELTATIGAGPEERAESRVAQRNGHRTKTIEAVQSPASADSAGTVLSKRRRTTCPNDGPRPSGKSPDRHLWIVGGGPARRRRRPEGRRTVRAP